MSGTLVLVNPAAGGRRAGRFWERLRPAAEAIGRFRVASPEGPEASRAAVREALSAGCDRVVAVGGDGTAHLVANAIVGAGSAATLGVLPAGTGSDLARALGIPREPREALRRALLGPPVAIDCGRCETETDVVFFVNVASAGVSGLVDEAVNAMSRRGRTAFLRATLAALRRYSCVPVRVTADGATVYVGPLFLLAVANGTTFGKGMRIAPQARPDDGLFDVVIVGEVAGLELLRRLPQVYFGRHMGARPVRHTRAREVLLEPGAALPVFDVDGETYTSGHASFTLLPGALRIAGELRPPAVSG